MKSYATLFLIGIIGGAVAPTVGFYEILGYASIVVFVLLLKIPVVLNEAIYKKIGVSLAGFVLGLLGDSLWSRPMHSVEYEFRVLILVSVIVFLFPLLVLRMVWKCRREDIQNRKKNKEAWGKRNLFSERVEDLERLKQYLIDENVNIIGVEGDWGSGKTFLMEGFQEFVSEKRNYEIVIVDVLAVRLDKYPEYLVREMDGLLRKHGVFSQTAQDLQKLLEAANLTYLSSLWMGQEPQYTKIFDKFRTELLGLDKRIIIIYEDIDRINDVNGIKDIFYLSEKLTAKNDEWCNAGIHVIYQYNPNHMEKIGLTEKYREKYIPYRIHLSKIDFPRMIRRLQGHVKKEDLQYLTDDEMYRLPPYLIGIQGSLLQKERQWIQKHFAERITIRRVRNFLREFSIKVKAYSPMLNQEERNLVVSMCFFEFFMPKVYQNLDEKNLAHSFDIADHNGKICSMSALLLSKTSTSQTTGVLDDLLYPYHHPSNFEMYMAWCMLGLDEVGRIQRVDYNKEFQDNTSGFYGRTNDDVYRQEALKYVNMERMVKFFYESGKAPVDDYVFHANRLVKNVLRFPKEEWKERYIAWRQTMSDHVAGTGTIMRIGASVWSEIFHSFSFASKKWSADEASENYKHLFLLYQLESETKDKVSSQIFNQRFIEDWIPVWEELPDVTCFTMAFKQITSKQIQGNYNEYNLFYVFVGRSLMALLRKGYILRPEPWSFEEILSEETELSEKEKVTNKALERATWEIENMCNCLEYYPQILSDERQMYQEARKYITFIQKVMKYEQKGKLDNLPHICVKGTDETSESLKELAKIEDDVVFRKAVEENKGKLPLVSLIDMMGRRKGK